MINSCAIGWFLSLSGVGLPGITEDILEIVGRAALPFGKVSDRPGIAVPGRLANGRNVIRTSRSQNKKDPKAAAVVLLGVT